MSAYLTALAEKATRADLLAQIARLIKERDASAAALSSIRDEASRILASGTGQPHQRQSWRLIEMRARAALAAYATETSGEDGLRFALIKKAEETGFLSVEDIRAIHPEAPQPGVIHHIDHDEFEGEVIGNYRTREGKEGVVLQQIGTKVVHVYGTKWLKPVTEREEA